ncbi:GGDEF domain-containing protein [Azospirillum baldaniorum]|uniref:Diguanylate cyclase, GGDEF domain n=2 Tax=Azospirillum baldaniorum TaxID=1064539 RepID=A0A9P1NMB4_9PROT|nr:diguanylate cyclase [Azospirillum baldaniorum]AWJ89739.1 GGDEF domain-containing protein [Azospirillum baldaniorum]TWA76838.1 PAS domain S-box-containing protein/diguanylate cyclase (GGDEF)-like protein [Azospirillum brasilense]CCC98558.1 putative diguanylate cyclase, GGDEF domain [Azospirillum baldaniorum]
MLDSVGSMSSSGDAEETRVALWRVFDTLPTGVCVTTDAGTILYANPALHGLLRYPPGGLTGLDLAALEPDDANLPALPDAPGERRLRCQDGATVWVAESVGPTTGPLGERRSLRVYTDVSHHRQAQAALRDQLLMKEVLFETLPVPVFVKNAAGEYTDCNDAFERYTGLERRSIVAKTAFAVMDPRIAKAHADQDRELTVNWGQRSYEEAVPFVGGTTRLSSLTKAVFCDSTGNLGGIVGVIHDLTEGLPSEERLQAILEQSPIGVSVSRRDDGKIIFVNTRFAELIGLKREDLIGRQARDYYLDRHQRERVIDRLRSYGSVTNMEVQFRRADGSSFWTLFTVNQAVIQGVQVNLAWIYDYTDRRNMEEALRDMASRDPLTGIYNRRSFMELARSQLARAHRFSEPMSVFVLDVDHFKRINDSYGHATGDDALRMVAGGCQAILREYDILGRLGGEEFVVVLPGATAEESRVVAERVRRHLSRMAIPGPEGRFHLTSSIGISALDGSYDTLEKAIHRADLALYRAKREGRNRVVVYEPGM